MLSLPTRLGTGVYRHADGRIVLAPVELLEAAGHALTPESLAWAERLLREEMEAVGYSIEPLVKSPAPEVAHA